MDNKSNSKELSPLKQAYLALEKMQARLDAAERSTKEPIAIVGMGCRFPGGVNNPEDFWRLLREGVNAVAEVPQDRLHAEAFHNQQPQVPEKTSSYWAGLLEEVDKFDAQFFNIAPREAVEMDPQQRLLLEVSWEAFENAGQAPDQLSGSATGVFSAVCTSDYSDLQMRIRDLAQLDMYHFLGRGPSMMSGRLSYILGLQGPSITVDTACSSSLTAIHLACQSLRMGECRMAIAGGVNVILLPHFFIAYSKGGVLAADGKCKTFDASGDGFVRGEGCGMIVLKRLSDALAEGARIHAVIRGSAVNQDGPSTSLTAPNGRAQSAVIREALRRGGVDPLSVGYLEAHGTGTSLGDPIEVRAVEETLCKGRSKENALIIGSVKTNLGHLEAAAGVAGVIKTVLALQHGEIPPHLHFKNPNPHISWEEMSVLVPTRAMPWSSEQRPRTACVSSFGFSGTNAHMVLEEAPQVRTEKAELERPIDLLVVSAKNESALKELASRYESHLARNPSESIRNFCFTANAGRAHFIHRAAMIATSRETLREQLSALSSGQLRPGLVYKELSHVDQPKIAFLFTGQGSQYVGMGRELFDTQPTFRKALERCDELLRPHLERPLLSVLYPGMGQSSPLDQTAYTQPALFALEYALAELWRSWGIKPSVVMGHSVGEYVAACVAGVFSLEDGLQLIAARARLMQALPGGGRMAAVFADEARVDRAIAPYRKTVSLACLNGPENMVISGVGADVEAVLRGFEAEGIEFTPLTVSHAFHSPLMEPMLDKFERVAAKVTYASPRIGVVSNVSGMLARGEEMANGAYWRRHIRQPVRFCSSMEWLYGQGYGIFMELGPSPVLLGMGARCLPDSASVWLPSLKRGEDNWRSLLDSLSALYVHGVSVDWVGFGRDYPRQLDSLPTYPFQRKRYWIEQCNLAPAVPSEQPKDGLHPLLGRRLSSPLIQDVIFEARFEKSNPRFIADHRICGIALMPATGFIAHAMAAARDVFGPGCHTLEQLTIHQPMAFVNDRARTVQFVLSPHVEGTSSFQIFSLVEGGKYQTRDWTLHATGRIRAGQENPIITNNVIDLLEMQLRCGQQIEVKDHYAEMQKFGFDLGTSFQGIEKLWRGKRESLGRLVLPKELLEEAREYDIHPALLDAANQVIGTIFMSEITDQDVYLPIGLERYGVHGSAGEVLWCHAVIHETSEKIEQAVEGDIRIYNEEGKLIASMEAVQFRRVDQSSLKHILNKGFDDWLYEIAWRPMSNPKVSEFSSADGHGDWLIFDPSNGIGEELSTLIKERGGRGVLVSDGERFECTDENHWVINYKEAADYLKLFKQFHNPWRGVIFSGDCYGVDIIDMTTAVLEERIQEFCGSVLYLVQAIQNTIESDLPHLWILTRGTHLIERDEKLFSVVGGALWGLGRVIALEHPELSPVLVDLNPLGRHNELEALFKELCLSDGEDQVAYRNNERHVARLIRHDASSDQRGDAKLGLPGESYQLEIVNRGFLDGLTLRAAPRQKPGPDEVEIRVYSTGLNFKDVLNALGMVGSDPFPLGNECAGTIVEVGENVEDFKPGDEVIAYAPGSFRSYLTTSVDYIILKPKQISLEEAAGLLVAFHTAYATLYELGKMSKGDRVLIHAATGGVGMAALQLAQKAEAEVFATAGSERKRAFLRSLGVHHVLDSRSLDFADEIMKITQGEGVDIVLNSLAGDFIPKSLSVLRRNGRFLEIGQRDLLDKDQVAQLKEGVQYYHFDGTRLNRESVKFNLRELHKLWVDGSLKPLPVKVFPIEDVISAFRYMAQAKHIGKIIVTHKPMSTGARSVNLQSDASYLITGGLGSLGLQVARWMVEKGARHLVVMGRSDPSQEAQQRISQLEQSGAKILVVKGDVSLKDDVTRTLEKINTSMPALRGVIHAAGVLDDGMLLQQDWERFSKVLAPKVSGAWNLHVATRETVLDFFVLFSSAASILPNYGQGNYTTANAFLDSLALYRKAEGLPALSINWSAWKGDGMVASVGSRELLRWTEQGFSPMEPEDALQVFEQAMTKETAQLAVMPVEWSSFFRHQKGAQIPAMLLELAEKEVLHSKAVITVSEEPGSFLRQLEQTSPENRPDVLSQYIRKQVVKVLRLDPSIELRPTQGLAQLGMDSLMAVELRNQITKDFGVTMPVVTFLKGSSLSRISAMLLDKLTSAASIVGSPSSRGREEIRSGLEDNSINDGWEEGEL